MMNTYKKYIAATICLLILSIGFISNAHEINFKAGSVPPTHKYPFRWEWKTSTGGSYQLKTNGYYLSRAANGTDPAFFSPFYNQYTPAINQWIASSAPVIIYDVLYSQANVVISTPATSAWENLGLAEQINAATLVYTNNNVWIDFNTTTTSPQTIKFAKIYVNPYPQGSIYRKSSDILTKVLVHELGHVLGLGHSDRYYPATSASVMLQGDIATPPTTHDEKDLTRAFVGYMTEGETYDSTGKVLKMVMPH